jgi:hypothetical protein
MGQSEIELGEVVGRSSLLLAEDAAGTLWAAKRVIDVAGADDIRQSNAWIHGAQVDPRKHAKRARAGSDLTPIRIQESCSERLGHPGSAFVCCASAQADDDPIGASIQGGFDQLPRSSCRGAPWIQPSRSHQSLSRRRGHLDHARPSVGPLHDSEGSFNRIAQRA